MKTKHGGKETKVKCPHCDYRARDKNSVEVHIDRKHQDVAGKCAIEQGLLKIWTGHSH